jgi:long-chain fatty acid transport protein
VALAAFSAAADDANFRPYVVGSRAAGMGGAFTALADDGSGPYYNPGGLAFVRRSQVSLSGSVYGVVSGKNSDALGDGHDFTFRDLNIFPVATSVVWKFGENDQPEGDGSALAVSVFVPDAIRTNDRDKLGSAENAFFVSQEQQTIWTGLTWARRWGRLGLGASLYGLFGTSLNQLELTAVNASNSSDFVTITSRTDEATYGVVGSIGLRWEVSDSVSLGFSAFSPELGWGNRRSFVRIAAGDNVSAPGAPATVVVVNAEDLSATPTLPARIQAGIAWSGDRWVLTADGIFLPGREVHDDVNDPQGLDRYIKRNAVFNAALGMEYRASDAVRLRVGFFTDFAATDEPVRQTPGSSSANNSTHVDRYGGTLSGGFRTEHTSTDVGINLSYGTGTDLVPNNLDFSDLKPTPATQLLFYVFLASAYQF